MKQSRLSEWDKDRQLGDSWHDKMCIVECDHTPKLWLEFNFLSFVNNITSFVGVLISSFQTRIQSRNQRNLASKMIHELRLYHNESMFMLQLGHVMSHDHHLTHSDFDRDLKKKFSA